MARARNYYIDAGRIKMTPKEKALYERVSRTKNGKPTKDNVAIEERLDFSGNIFDIISLLEGYTKEGYTWIDSEGVFDDFGDVGHIYTMRGTRLLTEDEEAMVDSILAKYDNFYQRAKVKEREALEAELIKIREKLEKL